MNEVDFNAIFEQKLIQQDQRTDAHDAPSIVQVQKLVIAFGAITTNRTQRMAIISEVVGRTVMTTKDLRLGEVDVLLKMLKDSHFINSMKEVCGA